MQVSSRRNVLGVIIGTAAVCFGATATYAQEPPFKIGFLGSMTGGLAEANGGELNGLKLRLQQLNYTVAGRKVEVIVEDDAGDPNTGVTKAQKLVESDKVDVVVGPFLSHIVSATQEYFSKKGVPNIALVGQTPENNKFPETFVPSWNSVQLGRIMGDYAAKKLNYKTANIVSSKYAFGQRVSDGFRESFEAGGGKIVRDLYIPLNTADYSPFIGGLPAAQAVFSAIPGADAIRYVKARHEMGLTNNPPLVAIISTVDGDFLQAQGEAALGAIAVTHYITELDNPENQAFIKDYTKVYSKSPRGYYEALGYTIGQIIENALTATKGKSGSKDLIEAIGKVDFKSPQGRFHFDAQTRFPYLDFYIVKVVNQNGRYGYNIIDTLKDVRPDAK